MRPIDFSDFLASDEARRETWRRRFATDETMRKAEPNRGHRAVASLVNRGKASAVITQNIDGLHQASGVPANRVIELHGNTTYAHCLDCARRYELEHIRLEFERTGEAPNCVSCGGYVKTATISFGQSMPAAAMIRAEEETLASDCSLLSVRRWWCIRRLAFRNLRHATTARLVILNREPTGLDPYADLVLHREIGATLGEAVGNN